MYVYIYIYIYICYFYAHAFRLQSFYFYLSLPFLLCQVTCTCDCVGCDSRHEFTCPSVPELSSECSTLAELNSGHLSLCVAVGDWIYPSWPHPSICMECNDDSNFIDARGRNCEAHRNFFDPIGVNYDEYSNYELHDLATNCCRAFPSHGYQCQLPTVENAASY